MIGNGRYALRLKQQQQVAETAADVFASQIPRDSKHVRSSTWNNSAAALENKVRSGSSAVV